jgi:hypothetical protein
MGKTRRSGRTAGEALRDDPNWAYGEGVYDTALAYARSDFGYDCNCLPRGTTPTMWDDSKYFIYPSSPKLSINMDPTKGGDLSGSKGLGDLLMGILSSAKVIYPVDFTSGPGPNLNISVSPVGVTWLNGAQP